MTRWTVHLIWASLLVLIVVLSRAEKGATAEDADKLRPEFPDKTKIAVVDIASVFKMSNRFKMYFDKSKRIVEEAESEVYKEREEIEELAERQGKQSVPSEERVELEQEVRERRARLEPNIGSQKQLFLEGETAVYYDLITMIDRCIEQFSKQHGLHVVLRISNDPIDQDNRISVMGAIQRPVRYFDPKLDITSEIIKMLDKI